MHVRRPKPWAKPHNYDSFTLTFASKHAILSPSQPDTVRSTEASGSPQGEPELLGRVLPKAVLPMMPIWLKAESQDVFELNRIWERGDVETWGRHFESITEAPPNIVGVAAWTRDS